MCWIQQVGIEERGQCLQASPANGSGQAHLCGGRFQPFQKGVNSQSLAVCRIAQLYGRSYVDIGVLFDEGSQVIQADIPKELERHRLPLLLFHKELDHGDELLWKILVWKLVLINVDCGHGNVGVGCEELCQPSPKGLELLACTTPSSRGHYEDMAGRVQNQLTEGLGSDYGQAWVSGISIVGRSRSGLLSCLSALPADPSISAVARTAATYPHALGNLLGPHRKLIQCG
mmetsp:Transcript_14147/g.32024  ORF Transcript_14147/g.32024 Transcript_14147/m.32024 type:complete len:230 (+) Transcript_14147:2873-3562(+)